MDRFKRPTDKEFRESMQKLREALTCPICGMPKVHSRLRGYHCHNEEHNQRSNLSESRKQ